MKTLIWQILRGVRRDRSWTVRLTTAAGQIHTRGGFDTRQEAQAAAVLMRAAIERGDSRFLDLLRRRSHDRLGDLLAAWRDAACPDRHGRPRAGAALQARLDHITGPLAWWADHSATRHTDQDREDYWAHRRQTVQRGTGDRTTELELGTLNDALHWAWRRGDLKELPRAMRTQFRQPGQIAHARDAMPASATELHELAMWLFIHRPPVLGWLCLWKAFTGLRDEECQCLLANPRRTGHDYPIGYADEHYLRIRRAKGGCNPRIALDDPSRPQIRPLLDMIRAWNASTLQRFNDSIPLFPAARRDFHPGPVPDGELTKALQAAARALGLPPRRGHALRAYYTSVRLAQGQSPESVAKELGQRSGADLVRDIYGVEPDDFDTAQWTSLADRFTWLPPAGTPPAWAWWTTQPSNITPIPQSA